MQMRGSGWAGALVVGACVVAAAAPARADQIKHPAGFTFALPDVGNSWEQEPRDDLITVSEGDGAMPELTVFVFAPHDTTTREHNRERTLTLQEMKAELPSAVDQIGLRILGERVKQFAVLDGKAEHVADADAVIGRATVDGAKAGYAIVKRGDRFVILVGVPADGIYERGMSNFRAVVHGLAPVAAGAIPRDVLPNLPALVGIKAVTATSTYRDKRDRYAAWRTVDYELADVGDQQVPKTAWCEGKPDEGVGEAITIRLAAPTRLDQIRIAAGVWLTQKLFDGNNRITALDVTVDGKTTRVTPPARREWTDVAVGRRVSTIEIKLAGVQRGKMDDSCLSAVDLVQGGEPLVVIRGVDGDAIDALPRTLASLQKLLGGAPPQLQAVIDFPFSNHPADGFFQGDPPAAKVKSWRALVAACRAWQHADADHPAAGARGCPQPATVDPSDDRPALIIPRGPGAVEVTFPSHREVVEVWRLRWRRGAWRLQAIDYDGT